MIECNWVIDMQSWMYAFISPALPYSKSHKYVLIRQSKLEVQNPNWITQQYHQNLTVYRTNYWMLLLVYYIGFYHLICPNGQPCFRTLSCSNTSVLDAVAGLRNLFTNILLMQISSGAWGIRIFNYLSSAWREWTSYGVNRPEDAARTDKQTVE